jgi:hypothetical protein
MLKSVFTEIRVSANAVSAIRAFTVMVESALAHPYLSAFPTRR